MSHRCEKKQEAIVQSPESTTENKRQEKPRCHMGTGQRGNLGETTDSTTTEQCLRHTRANRTTNIATRQTQQGRETSA